MNDYPHENWYLKMKETNFRILNPQFKGKIEILSECHNILPNPKHEYQISELTIE